MQQLLDNLILTAINLEYDRINKFVKYGIECDNTPICKYIIDHFSVNIGEVDSICYDVDVCNNTPSCTYTLTQAPTGFALNCTYTLTQI